MADDEDLKRPWREQYETVGRTIVPLWFAVTGIALGVGGILRDEPVAGACGAVAGVTVGWLQQQRASVYRRHNIALRKRLKSVRAEAKEQTTALEQRVTELQNEVLEQKMMRMLMNPNPQAAAELTGEIPAVTAPVARTYGPAPTPESEVAASPSPEPAAPTTSPEPAAPAAETEPVAEKPAAPVAEPAAKAEVTTPEPATPVAEPAAETPAPAPAEDAPAAETEPAKPAEPAAEKPATPAEAESSTPEAPSAKGEVEAGDEVGDNEPAEVVAEDTAEDTAEDVTEDDEETPKRRGAQIIDLPAKLKAKAKRQAAQAG